MVTLIVMSAGNATRFRSKNVPKKQWLRIEDRPLWKFVADRFSRVYEFDKVIITCSKDEVELMRKHSDYEIVEGGDTRVKSLQNALECVDSSHVLVTDTARCCAEENLLKELVSFLPDVDCVVPYLGVEDTTIFEDSKEDVKIEREKLKLIQTPQLSRVELLREAFSSGVEFSDESSAILSLGRSVEYVLGSKNAKKLTTLEDIRELKCLKPPSRDVFVGSGFDIHAFESGKRMLLGGVEIDCGYGFKAHSDGDVLLHSLIDALLGGIGASDIGEWFPDTDIKYKNANSSMLTKRVVQLLTSVGYEIVNVDITIMAQKPKISPYKKEIERSVANILEIDLFRVNIKATTAEKMGFVGREEGVFVHAITSLKYFDWTRL